MKRKYDNTHTYKKTNEKKHTHVQTDTHANSKQPKKKSQTGFISLSLYFSYTQQNTGKIWPRVFAAGHSQYGRVEAIS